VWWGIAGVIGTAIVGAFAVRLVAWLWEWKSRLVVTVRLNQALPMPTFYEEVWKPVRSLSKPDSVSDDFFRISFKLRTVLLCEKYMSFELKNNSSKKLSALTFCAHRVGNAFVQVGGNRRLRHYQASGLTRFIFSSTDICTLEPLANPFWRARRDSNC
jgi:hypothetical protein